MLGRERCDANLALSFIIRVRDDATDSYARANALRFTGAKSYNGEQSPFAATTRSARRVVARARRRRERESSRGSPEFLWGLSVPPGEVDPTRRVQRVAKCGRSHVSAFSRLSNNKAAGGVGGRAGGRARAQRGALLIARQWERAVPRLGAWCYAARALPPSLAPGGDRSARVKTR